ncbi:hypothetical protein VAR608DRAFT_0328 [Variovorax sp. HW608]|uniref:hypothetical protein n=1 Tax=Variovorax sp. HW608 TaxID=1034889 RepID=UPI0008200559|nr:hypothetical protein [Variovorax sp. HW608]SCK09287.1 hypothetical protein VAR608DRAFT_0328 [Variovorax sp. HW608]
MQGNHRSRAVLSARHKAQILARVGVTVPPSPAPSPHAEPLMAQQGQARSNDSGRPLQTVNQGSAAEAAWRHQVDILYAEYVAERAAKGLRESEEAERLARLRRANGH